MGKGGDLINLEMLEDTSHMSLDYPTSCQNVMKYLSWPPGGLTSQKTNWMYLSIHDIWFEGSHTTPVSNISHFLCFCHQVAHRYNVLSKLDSSNPNDRNDGSQYRVKLWSFWTNTGSNHMCISQLKLPMFVMGSVLLYVAMKLYLGMR